VTDDVLTDCSGETNSDTPRVTPRLKMTGILVSRHRLHRKRNGLVYNGHLKPADHSRHSPSAVAKHDLHEDSKRNSGLHPHGEIPLRERIRLRVDGEPSDLLVLCVGCGLQLVLQIVCPEQGRPSHCDEMPPRPFQGWKGAAQTIMRGKKQAYFNIAVR
jgi:hypothetical protein